MKLLHKPLAGMAPTWDAVGLTWELPAATPQNTRILINSPSYILVAQDTYFDLSGLQQDDETLFFNGIQAQDFGPAFFEGAVSGDSYLELLIVSSSPINDQALISALANGPGYQYTTQEFLQIVYWKRQDSFKSIDQSGFGSLTHSYKTEGGSGAPSPSSRIYVYRLASATNSTGNRMTSAFVPPTMIVLGATPKKEQEYQYLMRLKQVYETQEQRDVDV